MHRFSPNNFLSKAWDNLGDVDYSNSTNEFLEGYIDKSKLTPDNLPTGTGGTGDGLFSFLRDYKIFGDYNAQN